MRWLWLQVRLNINSEFLFLIESKIIVADDEEEKRVISVWLAVTVQWQLSDNLRTIFLGN